MMKQLDEQTYIKQTKSMQKMQEIADRLASTTPDLQKSIPPDAILKPSRMLGDSTIKQTQDPKKKSKVQPQQMMNKNEMSAQDWINKCQELQIQIQQQQELITQQKNELEKRQDRYVHRELEYRKTIEELQSELRSKTALDQGDRKIMENVYKDHNKIIEGINNIQLRTSKILVDQERDIIRFFNNKINEIKKQFEEERKKKGENEAEYIEKENQLISELEWIKNIAQKIDHENHDLMDKHKKLKELYQTQENDREMLIKELLTKKKKNAILKCQIEQYEKLLQEAQVKNDQDALSIDQSDLQANNSGKAQIRIRSVKSKDKSGGFQNSQAKSMKSGEDPLMVATSQSNFLQIQRYEQVIKTLQTTLRKEQKRVRDLKQMYVTEMEKKTDLELILRKCVEDIKEEIIQIKGEARISHKGLKNKNGDFIEKEDRDKVIEKLLNNEKIITLLYDNTFYPDKKKQLEVPEEEDENYNIEDQF